MQKKLKKYRKAREKAIAGIYIAKLAKSKYIVLYIVIIVIYVYCSNPLRNLATK